MAKTNVRGGQIADGANGVDLTVDVVGTLPVGNGGTGVANPTASRFLVGNGSSAVDLTKVVPSGAVVGDTDAQTLTSKTLTTPIIDSVKGSNGLTVVAFGSQTSAVNFLQIFNNITGGHTRLVAAGTDTDVGINLVPKGAGLVMNNSVPLLTTTGTQVVTNKDLTSLTNTFPSTLAPAAVRVSTTGQLTSGLTGPQTIDGVACVAGDRVLVRHQGVYGGNGFDNGVWVVAAGAWTRATDANTSAKMVDASFSPTEGTKFNGMVFRSTFLATDTLGTTSLSFVNSNGMDLGSVFQFPLGNSRNNGATFYDGNLRTIRVWDGAAWRFPKGFQDYSSTAPAFPQAGEVWFDTSVSVATATAEPFFKGLPVSRSQAVTSGVNIPFTAVEDTHAAWNSSSNYYVIPQSGLYRCTGQVKIDATNTHGSVAITNGAGTVLAWSPNVAGTAGFSGTQISDVLRFTAGATVAFHVQTTDALQDDGAAVENTFFIVEYVRA